MERQMYSTFDKESRYGVSLNITKWYFQGSIFIPNRIPLNSRTKTFLPGILII